jgi:type III secretory pathway component EscU
MIGLILIVLVGVKYIPALESIGTVGLNQLSHFLMVFGAGNIWRGLLTISLVSSLVSILFDTYTFYRYQSLRDSH